MVHRSTDSRLLTNLISQDKDYSKQFNALLNAADASLASLSAYAAASSPPASQIILQVAGSLASADEELRRYATSVDEWREQLKSLKTLEEEVANIIRDREILVTRVIKASRQKQHHSSNGNLARVNQYSSTSSLSTNNKSEFSAKAPIPGSSKLSHTQSELQACEAHLAAKERDLAIRRNVIVKEGLDTRFKAMINCGWAWGEIGKEALRTLEELTTQIDNQSSRPHLGASRPSSIQSSIGPSQSASQVNVPPPVHPSILGVLHTETASQPPRSQSPSLQDDSRHSDDAMHMVMTIPPAHAIGDIGLPVAVSVGNSQIHLPSPPPSNGSHDSNLFLIPPSSQHRKSGSISVKSVPLGSQGENNRNGNGAVGAEELPYQKHVLSRRITEDELEMQPNESSGEDNINDQNNLTAVDNPRFAKKEAKKQKNEQPPAPESSKRERRRSLLGSLRGLFGHHSRNTSNGDNDDQRDSRPSMSSSAPGGLSGLFGGDKKAKWDTRTDKNLKNLKNQSDDNSWVSSSPPPGKRMRKKLRRGGGKMSSLADEDAAVESDIGSSRQTRNESRTGLNKKRSMSVPPVTPSAAPVTENEANTDWVWSESVSRSAQQSPVPGMVTVANTAKTEVPLTRRSSMASASSAPPVSGSRKQAADVQVGRRPSLGNKSTGHVRSSSQPVFLDGRRGRDTVSYVNLASLNGATASTSLMSIVEDVARANREAEARLKDKKSLTLVELLPSAESTLSLTSSTSTVRPGSPLSAQNSRTNAFVPNGVNAPAIFVPRAPHGITRQDLEALDREAELLTRSRASNGGQQITSPPRVQSPDQEPSAATKMTSQDKNQRETRGEKTPIGSPNRKPPLRSALRNPTGRSVSPAPLELAINMVMAGSSQVTEALATMSNQGNKVDDDDLDSVSSYETGHELFFEDISTTAPKSKEPNGDARHIGGISSPPVSVVSGASTSIIGGSSGTPQRRKSVRVSLQPTFSPTPPAIDDDTDEEGHGPRSVWGGKPPAQDVKLNGWASKRQEATDVWENSSDEDEEYANAKRLLTKVSSSAGKKGW
ncbi:hypothetical protein M378DRAFT_654257 [Amanita muscaria Koide BX008]|uniref:Uncharacterized protein n=1 Tax=Amanita muscaria (strain Koide BX008) TaxID=946122 RepID=A0A0C2WPV8_AMAMK|nr:hypothetical protein M378DRAFT_654257 [Amanita muscaria Koide BX008]